MLENKYDVCFIISLIEALSLVNSIFWSDLMKNFKYLV